MAAQLLVSQAILEGRSPRCQAARCREDSKLAGAGRTNAPGVTVEGCLGKTTKRFLQSADSRRSVFPSGNKINKMMVCQLH